jgi:hypothetical protein
LHEATEIDPQRARYVNGNLADYLVPVNADIQQLEVILALDCPIHRLITLVMRIDAMEKRLDANCIAPTRL